MANHRYGHVPDEYRVARRKNRRLVMDIMTFQSIRALASSGVPGHALGLVGTIALSPIRIARLHRNRSKTLAIEFQDVMDGDRSLLLEFKKKW